MDVSDRIELHELPGRYGDTIDDRDWDGLGRIFTEDATFDLTDLGVPLLTSLAAIILCDRRTASCLVTMWL